MKKIIKLFLVFLFPLNLFSQVTFQDISFQEALRRSKETSQLIFMQVESSICKQCNEVANKAFEDKELASNLSKTFICLRITADHPDRKVINSLYNVEKGFGSLFIDQDKTILHRYDRSTTRAEEYNKQIDLALIAAGESLKISELEKEYHNGNKAPWLMEQLLLKRKTLHLNTDTLLEEYAVMASEDSLKSIRTLQFISQMAPLIGSKSDYLLRKNNDLFRRAWYTMTLPVRSGINNQIIYKSMEKAVREKNESFAFRVANFARTIIENNLQAASKAFDMNMLYYYRDIHDTLNYLVRALNYYDQYFMSVEPDSIKKKDSLTKVGLLSQAPAEIIFKNADSFTRKKTIQYAPTTQYFTNELNKAAWSLYTMTNEPLHLKKALQWEKRANELFESSEAMDTYARILYKTGSRQEAIEWETKSISLRKKRGFNTSESENILAAMKKNSEKIDQYSQ